ncbi:MAG: Transcription initiation factor TFIID subunit 1, partial [Marteilia pararefringens]
MNMTDIFPFFVDNKPLRFFKLFSSIYHQEYFPKYHNFSVPEAITLNYYLNQKEYVDTFKSNFLSSTNKSGREDHLPRGRRDLNSNFLYRFKQHGSKNLSDWIEGPAALWYKNQNFSLSGFTVNEMESLSAPSIALGQEDFELTQSYKSWRDNIIFDSNSPAALEKQENRDELERRQSMAGWVLGPNCHSYAEYCANKNQECFINEQRFENINDYLMPIRKEPHPLGSKVFSMFCHEEQNEINTIKWDDKILWNIDRKDKSMHVPLSFCLKDPKNRNNKFNRIFKSILNNAKNHSTIDLNCFISELGIKSSQDTPKAVKMPTIQTEALDKSKNSANFTQNSNQFALKHAVPVEQLHPLLFPTYLSISKLRTFHRHPLRRYSHGKISELSKFHPVQLIKTTSDLLDRKIKDVVMKDFDALSAKDGCIVLFEYLEQYPPFLNQVGMASALINYKRI